jgi:hypothetical protein
MILASSADARWSICGRGPETTLGLFKTLGIQIKHAETNEVYTNQLEEYSGDYTALLAGYLDLTQMHDGRYAADKSGLLYKDPGYF